MAASCEAHGGPIPVGRRQYLVQYEDHVIACCVDCCIAFGVGYIVGMNVLRDRPRPSGLDPRNEGTNTS